MKQTTDPRKMDLTAKVAFAKVYPAIAGHVVAKYGITTGRCLDAGSGPGAMAIALAEITELKIVSLDSEYKMSVLARKNFEKAKLSHRIETVTSDVCSIPFDDNYFDLIISRGSIFFWNDQPSALRDLYRVLKPGGVLFCGGGMGSDDIQREASNIIMTDNRFKDMRAFWRTRTCKAKEKNAAAFRKALAEADLHGSILNEVSGIWIEIIK